MKTVNDIIWSDLFNDNTCIVIHDIRGDRVASNSFRHGAEMQKWEQYEVYRVEYYPITNSLYILLTYNATKGKDYDPT